MFTLTAGQSERHHQSRLEGLYYKPTNGLARVQYPISIRPRVPENVAKPKIDLRNAQYAAGRKKTLRMR